MTTELKIITVGNPNRLVERARKLDKFMYNYKTGEIAVRNFDYIFVGEKCTDWHCLTSVIYPVYKNGVYIGDSLDNL